MASQKIADLDEYRNRIGEPNSQPEWQPIAAGIAALIDKYYSQAADDDQRTALTNLAGLLRHCSGFATALSRDVEHYAHEAEDSYELLCIAEDRVVDLVGEVQALRRQLEAVER